MYGVLKIIGHSWYYEGLSVVVFLVIFQSEFSDNLKKYMYGM